MKNRVLLKNCFLPGQIEAAGAAFVDHCNHRRYHESLGNLTPADVSFGRGQAILEARAKIKKLTIQNRSLGHHGQAAQSEPDDPEPSDVQADQMPQKL
jgi:putative transposase